MLLHLLSSFVAVTFLWFLFVCSTLTEKREVLKTLASEYMHLMSYQPCLYFTVTGTAGNQSLTAVKVVHLQTPTLTITVRKSVRLHHFLIKYLFYLYVEFLFLIVLLIFSFGQCLPLSIPWPFDNNSFLHDWSRCTVSLRSTKTCLLLLHSPIPSSLTWRMSP